jgi:hypothetical protein
MILQEGKKLIDFIGCGLLVEFGLLNGESGHNFGGFVRKDQVLCIAKRMVYNRCLCVALGLVFGIFY